MGGDTSGSRFEGITEVVEQVAVECPCGESVTSDDATDRVTCSCGAEYVITVTKICTTGEA